jgi:Beta-propeller repeat
MRLCCIVVLACFVVLGSSNSCEVAPQIVYGTYLGGRHKECATAIAVDGFGNAYVAGRTPSPDFPVTAGAFSTTTNVNNDDWTGFVSKISEHGDQLLYSTFLGGNYRSSANAIAVDSKGTSLRCWVDLLIEVSHHGFGDSPEGAGKRQPGSMRRFCRLAGCKRIEVRLRNLPGRPPLRCGNSCGFLAG